MRRKHPNDPSIRYLGVIAGYVPGRPEIPVERANDYTAWVLTTHTVKQLNKDQYLPTCVQPPRQEVLHCLSAAWRPVP